VLRPLFEGAGSFLPAVLYLGLAFIGLRSAPPPGGARRALGLLCATLAFYQLAEGMADVTGSATWDRYELALAPMIAIATYELIAAHLADRAGVLRARPGVVVYFGAVSLATFLGFVDPTGADARRFAILMMLGVVPGTILLLTLLLRQTRRARGAERLRGQLTVSAFFVGIGGAATDLLAIGGLPVPTLSRPALLASIVLLAFTTYQRQMIPSGRLLIMNVIVTSAVAVAALGVIFSALGAEVGPLVLATLFVAAFLVLGLRPTLAFHARQQVRRDYLATLGRFTAQMTHDLRNPIASVKGLAAFLLEERRRGRSIDAHEEDLEALLHEVEHMEQLLETYQRMGRLELERAPHDLRATLENVARGARRWTAEAPIEIHLDVQGRPLAAEVDEPLLRASIENLVRNAWEALSKTGGTIWIRGRGGAASGALELHVEDDGPGMSADVREHATDDFFSTKPDGGGLGLALVRRVVEAHGGELRVDSEEGQGARVTLRLPERSGAADPRATWPEGLMRPVTGER
jgi:two-component system sensor histidine kinase HydH